MDWNTAVGLYFGHTNTKYCHHLHKIFVNIQFESRTSTKTGSLTEWLTNNGSRIK
jgi:hypothetical protein